MGLISETESKTVATKLAVFVLAFYTTYYAVRRKSNPPKRPALGLRSTPAEGSFPARLKSKQPAKGPNALLLPRDCGWHAFRDLRPIDVGILQTEQLRLAGLSDFCSFFPEQVEVDRSISV